MGTEALASVGSVVAGLLFGIGWFIWFDSVAQAHVLFGKGVQGSYWVPGLMQTFSLFMVNVINWALVTEDSFGDEGVSSRIKCWLFFSFILAFGGLIGGVWVTVQESNMPSWDEHGGGSTGPAWGCLWQNLCIFASSLVFRAVRREEE